MNIRYVVPALGLIALTATVTSAQEIAKGVNLDGYVDTIFTGTTNTGSNQASRDVASTTDFKATVVAKVGWTINDKAKATFSLKSTNDNDSNSVTMYEAYGSFIASEGLEISAGKSLTPFGYYSGYATGLPTVTTSLTQANLYTGNAVGAWASYTVNEQVNVTAIVTDGYTGAAKSSTFRTDGYGVAPATNKVNRSGTVSPGIDVLIKATPEFTVDFEGYLDPSGGNVDPGNADKNGSVYVGAINAEYKAADLLAAFEVIYKTTDYGRNGNGSGDIHDLGWSAFGTYKLPDDVFAGAVTAQLGQLYKDKVGGAGEYTLTKAQLALLTNPVVSSQFGLNYEVFYINDMPSASSSDNVDTFGVAIEGLFVIP